MFERFTDRARKVMAIANQEAQHLGHEYIGTEHILLGLIKEGSGVAANVLKNLGVDLARIGTEVEKHVTRGQDMPSVGRLPQRPQAKKVVEYAIQEARGMNHNYVGTEHLLLGLVRVEDDVAAQVLTNLGIRLEGVRKEVLSLLGSGIVSSEVTPGGSLAMIKHAVELLTAVTQQEVAKGNESLAAELRELTERLSAILGRASGDSDRPQATSGSG